MAFEVDTAEVLRAAEEIGAIAASVKQLSAGDVRSMMNCVEENLQGEAADALKGVLSELSSDITAIGSGLESIRKALYDYAKRVEAADREAAERMPG